jgi:predicted HTH transcriptional regulator
MTTRITEEIEDRVLQAIKNGARTKREIMEQTGLSEGELELALVKLIMKNKIREVLLSGKCDCSRCPFRNFCPLSGKKAE